MLTIGRSATCKEHSVDLHRILKTNCDILINCCVVVQYFEGNVLRFQPFFEVPLLLEDVPRVRELTRT